MQKLELTWIGKGHEPTLEPRILLHDPEHSIGTQSVGSTAGNATDNMLIHGDNLLALKALEQDFAGKVKCIYIDPPYNTGNAFAHYDDGIEHSLWLSLIKPRLELLRRLLRDDGTMWISIDDDEAHYLKVLCDEVFGRQNFVANVVWEKKYAPQNDAKWLSDSHDHILIFAKNKERWRPNLLPRTDEMNDRYKNPDNDPRGIWKSSDLSVKSYAASNDYPITLPSGRVVRPPESRCWVVSEIRYNELLKDNRIWFGATGNNVPSLEKLLTEVQDGVVSKTIWFRDEVGDNQEAKQETKTLNSADVFATPKPERLVQRILTLATNPGDLVLDSFLGSGTTAAVAHKMGRRWIGIELGQHAYTHCYERLRKVVRGEDAGGITEAVGWTGGGGFRFYTLAPSLLRKDEYGQWVIDERYNAAMLAAAMAKHEGFRYEPHESVYWKQGRSTEKDFIYTTTQYVTVEVLERLRGEMKDDESLLICCRSYDSVCKGKHPNITIKKIPVMLLGRCEFGKDDYSLNVQATIVNLPQEDNDEDLPQASTEASSTPKASKKRGAKKATSRTDEQTLFE